MCSNFKALESFFFKPLHILHIFTFKYKIIFCILFAVAQLNDDFIIVGIAMKS